MPQMGESIAEGTVSKWLKKVGDVIKRDEPIFEISTDKVDAEIPSPSAGRLAEILVGEGSTVAVQTIVARIETDVAAAVPATTSAPTVTASAPAAVVVSSSGAAGASVGNGNGASFEERVRTKSSPLVRKIAAEHGIELASVSGSGIAGRVTKRDIESLLANRGAAKPPVVGRPATPHVFAEGPLPEAWPGDVVEPMTKMRALISDHMVVSRRTSAHVTSVFEVDLTRIAKIRAKKRAEFEAASGQRLSYLPFIIKSTVDGLRQFPQVNASVAGTDVIYRKQYNIGIAVALDWGLIVPVIKHADELSLVGITRQLNDLANRARSKRLKPEEVEEGTFTITNPGVFGSLMGTPIINQPQVAIMGIGAIEKRPKVIEGPDGEDTIAIRTCAYFSLSFDHRLIDGAVADEFLAFVKKQLETFPETAL
jgi:2-oxoglutarate dehydrogenase E2 component (dihydrolipoamide succinyltransferase)